MFARIFGRSAGIRRSLGLGALLLALAGGALAIWAAVESSASTLVRVLHAITGIGAIIAGRRIYRRSQALLFPRSRMNAPMPVIACRTRTSVEALDWSPRKRFRTS